MAALTNTRWELYCIGVASGKSKAQSYNDAGFQNANGNTANASTLGKRPEVQARIAELISERTGYRSAIVGGANLEHLSALEEAAATGEIDRGWVIKELMMNVVDARNAAQFTASNQALKMLGEELGMFQKTPPAPEEKARKVDETTGPISVDAINKLLAKGGYDGPPIDLTKSEAPVLAEKPSKSAEPEPRGLVRTGNKFDHSA